MNKFLKNFWLFGLFVFCGCEDNISYDVIQSETENCILAGKTEKIKIEIIQKGAYQNGFRLLFNEKILKIPNFNIESKIVEYCEEDAGNFCISKDNEIVLDTKGAGYGGFSTKRFFVFKNEKLILLKQSATKDFLDENYQLKGEESDWYIQYEKKD